MTIELEFVLGLLVIELKFELKMKVNFEIDLDLDFECKNQTKGFVAQQK